MRKRDKNIRKDYFSGKYKIWELTTKYKLSHARLYQIIDAEKIKD